MMQEIYQRGPISCGIAVPADLEPDFYKGGIYEDKSGDQLIVHDVSVVGYGVENGTKYWTVRNSWGANYGESGYFRLIRGINNIGIESNCSWAVPKDTWSSKTKHYTTEAEKKDPKNDLVNSNYTDSETAVAEEGFLKPKENNKPKCRRT
jgi:cathepsin X